MRIHFYGENIRHLQSLNSDGDDNSGWKNFYETLTHWNADVMTHSHCRCNSCTFYSSSSFRIDFPFDSHKVYDCRKTHLLEPPVSLVWVRSSLPIGDGGGDHSLWKLYSAFPWCLWVVVQDFQIVLTFHSTAWYSWFPILKELKLHKPKALCIPPIM